MSDPTPRMRPDGAPGWTRLAEPLYRVGTGLYHGAYDRRWRRPARLAVPVLSVGNLEVGGMGKTPTVIALAAAALRAGRRPAILIRGYGGAGTPMLLRAGREGERAVTAAEAGDEALLLSRRLPTVPVVVGKRRVRGARRLLATGERVDLFLLDDGFQHRGLHRDRDLVLLDRDRPLASGRLLPAGTLREPPAALGRAHHLLLTGGEPESPAGPEALSRLDLEAPGIPRTRAWMRLGNARAWSGAGEEIPLRGRRVHAVAGIARPERFRTGLQRAGAEIAGWSAYRDHHPFSRSDAVREEEAARSAEALLVTTAKDAVRLEGPASPDGGWMVAEAEMEAEGGWDRLLASLMP